MTDSKDKKSLAMAKTRESDYFLDLGTDVRKSRRDCAEAHSRHALEDALYINNNSFDSDQSGDFSSFMKRNPKNMDPRDPFF